MHLDFLEAEHVLVSGKHHNGLVVQLHRLFVVSRKKNKERMGVQNEKNVQMLAREVREKESVFQQV